MKRYFLPILVTLLGSCQDQPSPETVVAAVPPENELIILSPQQQQNASLAFGPVSRRPVGEQLELQGTVDVPPQNIVSVSFPPGGYLRRTQLLPGMHVRRGETIALMEDAQLVQLQQDYLTTRSRLQQLRLDYERQRTLNESKTASDKVFQEAKAAWEGADIQLRALAEKLRLAHIDPNRLQPGSLSRQVRIPAPIDGFVSKVNVNIGRYVQPQDVLFELINPKDIHAALDVFEKDINKLRTGQQVRLSFIDEPGRSYRAEVLLVTRNVDENRRGIVHCHFKDSPEALKPGMFLHARIELSARNVPAVPEEALARYQNSSYVFLREPGGFRPLRVQPGARQDGWVALPSDSNALAGRQIVLRNAYVLLSAWKNKSEE